jgi:hypothetical protein
MAGKVSEARMLILNNPFDLIVLCDTFSDDDCLQIADMVCFQKQEPQLVFLLGPHQRRPDEMSGLRISGQVGPIELVEGIRRIIGMQNQTRKMRTYAPRMGRPGLAPGIYFRSLLIGYFEGIDSERGIAWRLADSLALRQFVRIGITESTLDHSTISRTRRLIPQSGS